MPNLYVRVGKSRDEFHWLVQMSGLSPARRQSSGKIEDGWE